MITLDAKKVLPWISFLIFFAVVNETVFNVSTPAIATQYALSPTGVSWMMTVFIVFFGVGSVIFGRLSDLFSLKRLITIGVVTYATASLAGFLAQGSYPLVLVARAFQGIGGSALPALVMVIVARYIAPEVRGRVFGSIGSVVAVGLGLGPVLGGFVSGTVGWSWLFLLPLLTPIALPILRGLLPDEEHQHGPVDYWGAGLMTLGLGSLIVWLTYPEWYWLVGGVTLMVGFVVRILVAKEPFIQPDLFSNRAFRRGVLTTFFAFGTFIAVFFVLPIILTKVQHLTMETIGLALFPGAISGVIVGPLGGRLADARGNRFVLLVGITTLAVSVVGLALVLTQAIWVLSSVLVLTYVGFSLIQTGLINAVSQTLPEEETGVGMGLFNLVGILAGAVGTAVVAKVLELNLVGYEGLLLAFGGAATLAGGIYALTLAKGSTTSPGGHGGHH